MAIDTTAKRASASAFLLPFYNGIITDGTIDLDETIAASWMYNGISPLEVEIPTPISETTISFTLHVDQNRSFILYIDQNRSFILEL
jgi:hypothetical protein